MKVRFLILLSIAVLSNLPAQELDTTPYILDHHQNRLDQFSREPIKTGQIIFLGNSITEGGQWSDYFPDQDVLNRGISGDIAHGVFNRLDEIIERQPSKLFLLIGVNDLSKNIPESIVANKVDDILGRLQKGSPNTEIIVQSILPVNDSLDDFPDHYKQYAVMITNQLYKQICRKRNIRFLNLYLSFLNDSGRMDPMYSYDGLHLNDKGYALWVKILKKEGLM